MNNVVSLSGGKDSSAMILMMLERGEPIHSVVFFDTGWEHPEMYEHIAKLQKIVTITWVYPRVDFDVLLKRYGWPDARRRWCTREKITAIKKYTRQHNAVECVGFAADEASRTTTREMQTRNVRFPLVEWEITEKMALDYCQKRGFDWGGLYENFNRVSCYCCPLKSSPKTWRMMRNEYPDLWARMLEMDNFERNRGFYGQKTVQDLENRFVAEDMWLRLPGLERV